MASNEKWEEINREYVIKDGMHVLSKVAYNNTTLSKKDRIDLWFKALGYLFLIIPLLAIYLQNKNDYRKQVSTIQMQGYVTVINSIEKMIDLPEKHFDSLFEKLNLDAKVNLLLVAPKIFDHKFQIILNDIKAYHNFMVAAHKIDSSIYSTPHAKDEGVAVNNIIVDVTMQASDLVGTSTFDEIDTVLAKDIKLVNEFIFQTNVYQKINADHDLLGLRDYYYNHLAIHLESPKSQFHSHLKSLIESFEENLMSSNEFLNRK